MSFKYKNINIEDFYVGGTTTVSEKFKTLKKATTTVFPLEQSSLLLPDNNPSPYTYENKDIISDSKAMANSQFAPDPNNVITAPVWANTVKFMMVGSSGGGGGGGGGGFSGNVFGSDDTAGGGKGGNGGSGQKVVCITPIPINSSNIDYSVGSAGIAGALGKYNGDKTTGKSGDSGKAGSAAYITINNIKYEAAGGNGGIGGAGANWASNGNDGASGNTSKNVNLPLQIGDIDNSPMIVDNYGVGGGGGSGGSGKGSGNPGGGGNVGYIKIYFNPI